ncbi:RING-H2 finger protein ATL57-like [Abeliophyllum distichum]|uniref:RING-H2 finger protein ATL57-like n=1 Tax=Abeliophyllum distichum TaxID=126358 RepID=A0ABD1TEL2_9LAMI
MAKPAAKLTIVFKAVDNTLSQNTATRNPNSQSIDGNSLPLNCCQPSRRPLLYGFLLRLHPSLYRRGPLSSSSSFDFRPCRNPTPTSNHNKGVDSSAMKTLPLVAYDVAVNHLKIAQSV